MDLLPEGAPRIPFLDRQRLRRARPADPGQVQVVQPIPQLEPDQETIRGAAAVQPPGQGGEVVFEPGACLLAPARPLLRAESPAVLAAADTGQGCRACGVAAVAGGGILGQM